MNHPTREEWMDFVYDELDPNQKAPMAEHLQGCAECGRRVSAWRGTMGALDAWRLNAPPKRVTQSNWVRWAAAAAVLLGIGFGIGEATARQSFRREFAAESAQTRELLKELGRAVAENRARDQDGVVAVLHELETRRATEMKVLREDLETVAANTQAQLGRLVSFSAP